ncbi:hypothetical protein V8F33_008506, partial [Rhypophila sp. PSN 637]
MATPFHSSIPKEAARDPLDLPSSSSGVGQLVFGRDKADGNPKHSNGASPGNSLQKAGQTPTSVGPGRVSSGLLHQKKDLEALFEKYKKIINNSSSLEQRSKPLHSAGPVKTAAIPKPMPEPLKPHHAAPTENHASEPPKLESRSPESAHNRSSPATRKYPTRGVGKKRPPKKRTQTKAMQVGLWAVKNLKNPVIGEDGVASFTAEWVDTTVSFRDIRGTDAWQQGKELIID